MVDKKNKNYTKQKDTSTYSTFAEMFFKSRNMPANEKTIGKYKKVLSTIMNGILKYRINTSKRLAAYFLRWKMRKSGKPYLMYTYLNDYAGYKKYKRSIVFKKVVLKNSLKNECVVREFY